MRVLLITVVLAFICRGVFASSDNFWREHAIGILQNRDLVLAANAEKSFVESIQNQTRNILNTFPPSEWSYVSVGRSGAAIAGQLEVLSETRPEIEIKTLAWSSLRESKQNLEPALVQFANEYLELQLPRTNKRILFVDYVQTGDSIVALHSFLKDLRPKGQIGYYLLLSPEHASGVKFFLKKRIPRESKLVVLSGKDLLLKALQLQTTDYYAEYGRLPIKGAYQEFKGVAANVVPEPQAAHQELVDWLRAAHHQEQWSADSGNGLVRSCRWLFTL